LNHDKYKLLFGTEGPLTPTQRFWNLKQLASKAEGLHYLPISCDQASVTCAALGDATTKTHALHIVNNGAERKVILKNLPATLRLFQIFYTSKTASMQEGPMVLVHKGEAGFQLPANSFTTLTSQKIK
jgi:hypothetical protein